MSVNPRVALAPATVRIKLFRECSNDDRLIEYVITVDGFEDFYHSEDLQGCDSPKVFDFFKEIRLPGDYIIVARLQPSGEFASTTLELR